MVLLPISDPDSINRDESTENLEKAQWKLFMKLQKEVKRKIGDIKIYLTENLTDLTKLQEQQEETRRY